MGGFLQGLSSGANAGGSNQVISALMKKMVMSQLGGGGGFPSPFDAPTGTSLPPGAPDAGPMQGPVAPPSGVPYENRLMTEVRQQTGENAPGMFQPGGVFGGGLIGALNNPDPNAPGMFDQGGYLGGGLIGKMVGKPESPERLRDRMMGRIGGPEMFDAMSGQPSSLSRQMLRYGLMSRGGR